MRRKSPSGLEVIQNQDSRNLFFKSDLGESSSYSQRRSLAALLNGTRLESPPAFSPPLAIRQGGRARPSRGHCSVAFAMSAFDDFDDDEPRQTLRGKRAGLQGLGSAGRSKGVRTGLQDVAADGRGGKGRMHGQ